MRVATIATIAAIALSCGSNRASSVGGTSGGGGDDALGDAGYGSFGAGTAPPAPRDGGPCVNLQCRQVDCSGQNLPADATTVSGVVYDPAGQHPVYDAIVYVPNEPVKPFTAGVVCDKCGVLTTGNPVVADLSDPGGKFQLRNVPVGAQIPLVIQVGKWRRQTTIASVKACADNPITDPDLTRLPRSQGEGDLPRIALATGGCDAFECLLRKVGIADAEFTSSVGPGRVHVYQGVNGMGMYQSQPSTTLWSDESRMMGYDLVINSCECAENGSEKPAASLQNHFDYANAGGRVFDTHYNYYWLDHGPAPFPSTASFSPDQSGPATATATIDTSFPKGAAFAQWLQAVGASTVPGQISVDEAKYDVTSVAPGSTRWIYGQSSTGPDVFHYTFNTPVGVPDAQQCGKVLFSDFHAAAGSNMQQVPFPGECNGNPMSAQELALEFMLFDLSSCIQTDTQPPTPPPVY